MLHCTVNSECYSKFIQYSYNRCCTVQLTVSVIVSSFSRVTIDAALYS